MYESGIFFLTLHICILSSVALYTVSKQFVSIAGTIPRRKPTTMRSLRVLKLKEPEVGEGSSPVATKQLEFAPRLEPVIKTTTKKVFTQNSTFGDMEASTGTKEVLPH
jgi:hypothetical protein